MPGFNADMIQGLAQTALIVSAGWLLAAFGWVGPESRQPLMRLVIWLFFPALIYDRVHANPLISTAGKAALFVGTGFLMIVGGILIGALVGRLLRVADGVSGRSFAYASGINNFGYLGIPLTAALFDRDVVGVLLVHNVGVEAAIWTVGVAYLSGHSGWRVLRNLIHPMTMVLAVALAVNLMGWGHATLPTFLGKVCHTVGNCAIPVGLILTGIYLHETLRGFDFRKQPKVTAGFALVRFLLVPLAILAVASHVADPNLRRVMLVQAAMPAGMFTFLIVSHCKGDVSIALRGTIVTSLLCPLTIPVWIEFGRRWLGIH
ncbi:MAG: AEC family transporter [Opitutales bacterium]